VITLINTAAPSCDGYALYVIQTPVPSGILICQNSPIPAGYYIEFINSADPSCDGYSGYFIKEA
jgi:hypothetical protein